MLQLYLSTQPDYKDIKNVPTTNADKLPQPKWPQFENSLFIEVLNQNQAHSRCDTHNFAMKDTAQKSVTHFDVNFNLPKQRLGQCRHTTAEYINTQLCIFNLTLYSNCVFYMGLINILYNVNGIQCRRIKIFIIIFSTLAFRFWQKSKIL